jgi:hypothetical protein
MVKKIEDKETFKHTSIVEMPCEDKETFPYMPWEDREVAVYRGQNPTVIAVCVATTPVSKSTSFYI